MKYKCYLFQKKTNHMLLIIFFELHDQSKSLKLKLKSFRKTFSIFWLRNLDIWFHFQSIDAVWIFGLTLGALFMFKHAVAADGYEPVQIKLHKSLRLWLLFVDLEESLGSLESTRVVYERILDLRIATPQIIINYAVLLEVWISF